MVSTVDFSGLVAEVGALKAADPEALAQNLRVASERLISAMDTIAVEDGAFVEAVLSTAAHLEANGNHVESTALIDKANRFVVINKWSAATQLSFMCARIRVAAIQYGGGADEGELSIRIASLAKTDTLKRFARAQLLLTAHIDATCCGTVVSSVATRLSLEERSTLSGYAGCLADMFAAYSYAREERWDKCIDSLSGFRKAHKDGDWYTWFSDAIHSLGVVAQYIGSESLPQNVMCEIELGADNVQSRLQSVVSFVSVANAASMYAKFGHKTLLAEIATDIENTERTAYVPYELGLSICAMNNAASGLYTADYMRATLASIVNTHSARMLKPFIAKYLPDLLDAVGTQSVEGPTEQKYSFRALCESFNVDSRNDVHQLVWASFMTHLQETDDVINNDNLRMASIITRLCRYLGKTEGEILAISVALLATPDFRRQWRTKLPVITLSLNSLDELANMAKLLGGWTVFEAFDRERDNYTARLQNMQLNAKTADTKVVIKAATFLFQLTNLRRTIDEDTANMLSKLSGL